MIDRSQMREIRKGEAGHTLVDTSNGSCRLGSAMGKKD